MNKEEDNNLIETLYISSITELKEDIEKGLKELLENCVSEEKIEL